jgi:hypothetical protein
LLRLCQFTYLSNQTTQLVEINMFIDTKVARFVAKVIVPEIKTNKVKESFDFDIFIGFAPVFTSLF